MQTPYELKDTLWLVYSWLEDILPAEVSMMTLKADGTWKIRVSYRHGTAKSVHECALTDINKSSRYGNGVFDNYELARTAFDRMRAVNKERE